MPKHNKNNKAHKSKKSMCNHIVKRKGHIEEYDDKKVYASVYSAAISCHYGEKQAEKIANSVMRKINAWVNKKAIITSGQIRDQILVELADPDVKLMYKHHLDLC